jgi:hypothetical protein
MTGTSTPVDPFEGLARRWTEIMRQADDPSPQLDDDANDARLEPLWDELLKAEALILAAPVSSAAGIALKLCIAELRNAEPIDAREDHQGGLQS